MDEEIQRNLMARFAVNEPLITHIKFSPSGDRTDSVDFSSSALVFVHFPASVQRWTKRDVSRYIGTLSLLAEKVATQLSQQARLVIEVKDMRVNSYLEPLAMLAYEALEENRRLRLQEIIVVTPEMEKQMTVEGELTIVHRYLLVFLNGDQ